MVIPVMLGMVIPVMLVMLGMVIPVMLGMFIPVIVISSRSSQVVVVRCHQLYLFRRRWGTVYHDTIVLKTVVFTF